MLSRRIKRKSRRAGSFRRSKLNEEYARVLADKKQAYAEYRQIRDEMKKLAMAKHNVDEFLNRDESEIHRKRDRERHLSR